MGTSDRAFNQVREILEKLDRSIDAARNKRLHVDDDAEDLGPRSDGPVDRAGSSGDEAPNSPSTDAAPAPGGKARPIGRAKPLRRDLNGSREVSGWANWGQERVG